MPTNIYNLKGKLVRKKSLNGEIKQSVTMAGRITNGYGGITEETDPTVPQWAKEPTKPTYTAEEVGALPDDTPLFDGDYNSLSNKPNKLSDFENDDGFISEHQPLWEYVKRRYYEHELSPVLSFAHNYWTGGEVHLRDANLDEITDENGDFARFELYIPSGSYIFRMNQTPFDYAGARCSLSFYDVDGTIITSCVVLKRNEVMGIDMGHGRFTLNKDAYYIGLRQALNWSYVEELNVTDVWIVSENDEADGRIIYTKLKDGIATKDFVSEEIARQLENLDGNEVEY